MTYTVDSSKLMFALNRTEILDISVNDTITVDGFEGLSYKWTDHDSDFLENNPDAEIYLQAERSSENHYKATGIMLK